MAGLEVEDPAHAARPGAAGAEHLAAGEPADEHQIVGLGNVEVLAVHLLVGQLEGLGNAPGDGMGGAGAPHAGAIALAPLEAAGGAQNRLHGLGRMGGMQADEAHALEHSVLHALHDLIGNAIVRHVRPPDQHVRVIQHLLRQAALGHAQRHGAHDHVLFLLEEGLQRVVQSVGMHLADFLGVAVGPLTDLLVVRVGHFGTAHHARRAQLLRLLIPDRHFNHWNQPPCFQNHDGFPLGLLYHEPRGLTSGFCKIYRIETEE